MATARINDGDGAGGEDAALAASVDAGPRQRGSVRTCVVTREAASPDTLLRFVEAPDGTVMPDLKRSLPGRGVWISAEAETVRQAQKRNLFARALKKAVTVPPDLADKVDALLRRDCLQGLSLANKAGAVITGFAKVEAVCRAAEAVLLLHAAEAGDDGVAKLTRAAAKGLEWLDVEPARRRKTVPAIRVFTGEELDLALGRSHVIHAALVAGSGGAVFRTRWRRYARYRGAPVSDYENDPAASQGADRTFDME